MRVMTQDAESGTLDGHAYMLARHPSPRSNFDGALCALVSRRPVSGLDGKRDGRRAAMCAALEYQATWTQIRRWRRGIARAPQWAIDMVARKLSERAATATHHVESLNWRR